MHHDIKIGIVEDELLIAEKIRSILDDIGYKVCEPVSSYDAALEMLKNEKPDFVLLDVNLGKEKDGIDIARHINEKMPPALHFLTANSDMAAIERAKAVKPFAYLVKPFTKDELFASIEIALNNFGMQQHAPGQQKRILSYPQLPFSHGMAKSSLKIMFTEIVYVESKENYVYVHTLNEQKVAIRSTLQDFIAQLPPEKFFRVHRSYVIQTDLIKNMDYAEVAIAGVSIPLGKTYRDELFEHLGIKQ